jgi:iron complex outermembrane receptor protein
MKFRKLPNISARKSNPQKIVCWLILCLYSPVSLSQANQSSQEFNIDSVYADVSLIEFAKQADITILFPYEIVKARQVNTLRGNFTIEQGISMLLEGTGLVASFERDDVVTIKRISIRDSVVIDKSMLQKIIDLFMSKGDTIVIFPEEPTSIELIEVNGIRGSMDWALDIKQESIGVSESIQAEEIGKFPDLNLAESLQRITGVSIDRSEGEGQFVTVRGLGPQFNTVLSNGRRLATDNQGREFSFDTIASELVTSVSVDKTFSASQPSGGIGSVINIKTARPMAAKGLKIAGSVKATFDNNSQETTPQGTVFISHSNDKLGWLVSLSHQQRKARINEVQTDGWLLNTDIPPDQITTTADNVFVPRNYDQRVRFDERTRTGGTLVLQYKARSNLDISLDYLQSDFTVKTDSTSLGHWFTSSNLEDLVTDENGTAISFSQNIGHATDFHARTFDRPSSLSARGLNSSWQVSPKMSLDFDISSAKASTKDRIGAGNALTLIGYLNRSSFSISAGDILPRIAGFESPDSSIVDALGNMTGVSDYLDPINSRTHVMLRRGWNIEDRFDQLKTDITLFEVFDSAIDIKLGVMYSNQSKRNERWDNEKNAVHCSFCGYFPDPDLPENFQTVFDVGSHFLSGVSGSEFLPKQWLRHNGEALFGFLESVSDINFDAVIRNNSFTVSEKVMSAYLEGQQRSQWRDIEFSSKYGLRYENTNIVVSGFESDLLALTILDQTELGQTNSPSRAISESASYENWLPSVATKIEWDNNIIVRFSLSRSLTRPTMTQLSPSLVVNTTRQGGDLRASSGNPYLKPFESTNLDWAFEWYYQPLSYVSISYFNKRVKNFIVSSVTQVSINDVTDPSTGADPSAPDTEDILAEFDLTSSTNSQAATVSGFEFAIQHDFDSGWGVLANMTMVNSNAKLNPTDVSQKFALTGLSDSHNLIVYYEKGSSQIRLAWNHRGGFLQSLVQIQGPEPSYVRSYQQLDLSASYALNDNFSVFIEGVNITQENVLKHGRYRNQLLLAQQAGARYSLGLRGSF